MGGDGLSTEDFNSPHAMRNVSRGHKKGESGEAIHGRQAQNPVLADGTHTRSPQSETEPAPSANAAP